ncbi:RNA-guided endonuclease InsQ/TnpB family protein [Candidatus Nitrososphaera sp. FF02]|uniref:RNA-guided endonuclease InsQ/TnpB family protein n=1 Tax=Candidatus Nitrososphaera sp. FF02 TaxID=3398226 RepID=UPI0039E898DD
MLSYRFRLYPSRKQEEKLVSTIEINRIIYNYFLRNFRSRNDMNYALTELKERHPILRSYHSKMLQSVSVKVASARKSLFELKRRGHRVGKPLLLKENHSFTYNQSGFKIEGNRLFLSKIGNIEIRLHRQPIHVKQVTVKRKNGRWYAVVTCDVFRRMHSSLTISKPIGIDAGITHFSYDSDGNNIENPLFLKKMLLPLKRNQRRLSRRRRGSINREKAKMRAARLHERIANRRRDFLHKCSVRYSGKYDAIFLERLRTLNMVRNRSLARSILDSGWRTFRIMLQYKANRVIEVEPHYTSIICSKCSNKVPKSLAIRLHSCSRCGLILDRDYNAAVNILQRGLALLGLPVERRELTPVETLPPPVISDGRVGSLKQEIHASRVVSSRTTCSSASNQH